MRVYEFARDNQIESAEVIAAAQQLGFEIGTASSGLTDDQAEQLVQHFNRKPPDAENSDDGHAETEEPETTVPVSREPIGLLRPHRYAKRRKIRRDVVLAAMRELNITPVDRHRPLSQENVDALDDFFEIPA